MSNMQAAVNERAHDTDALALAPFDRTAAEQVRSLVARLDSGQRLWLSGYLAGASERATAPAAAPADASRPPVTILFGSQSGNSERLAKQAAELLAQRGVRSTLLDMMDCRKNHLQEASTLLVIVSTHGDGDPPDRAVPFHEMLHGRKAIRLEHVRYSVLALGDSSYERFCETGRQFDARLEALGAQRLHPRTDCDVDFETPARGWMDAILGKVAAASSEAGAPAAAGLADAGRRTATVSQAYTRKNPYQAAVLTNQRLTVRGSTKDVRHIELSLEGSNIHYEPGDAIGVVPRNSEDEVGAVLSALQFSAEAPVTVEAQSMPLRQALVEQLEIGPLNTSLVRRYAEATASAPLAQLLANAQETAAYLHGRYLVDLVREHAPAGLDAAAFVQLLRPIAQRLYSIASSPAASPDEAHLTVGVVEYDSLDRPRRGVVSGFLAGLTNDDAIAPIYLHRNSGFRLPAEAAAPIIMIGAGTGVAPYRAFVAEREARGATGRNWLVFGDRSFETDFLYQAEWLAWRASGALTRLDAAFSRDQEQKVYVQHRLRERGADLWAWLQEGAYVYVCGDAEHMAPDVHEALLHVVREHGALSAEDADEYMLQLQRERRYQRDVY